MLEILPAEVRGDLNSLILLFFLASVVEVASLATIFQFLRTVADPSVQLPERLAQVTNVMSMASHYSPVNILGGFSISLLTVACGLRLFTFRAQFRFTSEAERIISRSLFQAVILQRYGKTVGFNSNEIAKDILAEVAVFTNRGLLSLISMISQILAVLLMLSLLVVVNPLVAVMIAAIYGFLYVAISRFLRDRISLNAQGRFESNQRRYVVVNEVLKNIKYVKVSHAERRVLSSFDQQAVRFSFSQANNLFLGAFPKPVIEALTFGSVISLVTAMSTHEGSLSTVLPTMSLFAIAGYRLLPGVQQIFNSVVQISNARPAIEKIGYLFDNYNAPITRSPVNAGFRFESLALENVSYRYEGSSSLALHASNFVLSKGQKVAVVGASGSGKSTLLNLLLGLTEPLAGKATLNDEIANPHTMSALQSVIGYVPQDVFLLNDTVCNNIAFCAEAEQIDELLVRKVAEIAGISEFIEEEFAEQYQTVLLDNGSNLSGGQRQRIGIARALYKCPQLLVLDEATSALDQKTEMKVLRRILSSDVNLTLVMITHRASLLQLVDKVYKVEAGKVTIQSDLANREHKTSI